MKKRLLSILLCLSMVFGIAVPTMTPQADAVIGAVIGTGLKMCTSIVNGCIKACKNDADKGAGKGVLAMFKYAAADFTGIDFGGSSGGSDQGDHHPEGRPEPGGGRAQAASTPSWRRTAPPSISCNSTVSNGICAACLSRWRA